MEHEINNRTQNQQPGGYRRVRRRLARVAGGWATVGEGRRRLGDGRRRDYRASKAALFDGIDNIEEGGIRASSSYSREIDDHTNDNALDSLEDRVSFLKRLTGDIHGEVENHNRMLDRMGTTMDATRGIMSGTMDRFKIVLEKKSSRKMFKLAAYFVVSFFVIYYFIRVFRVFMYG
ncbi:hypothetical protein RHGRI_012087 [Rhododendron griersonianum]|uniref:t-SNARE coiled-coil homology domain-containing protein n=1 Tax=Rhododendron griersonianum TaxID=479676 RepID=A0AAV6KP70_9ERIC|nr:hypothetical protein RHGRI_012087 [Rhododendron griersonianum]